MLLFGMFIGRTSVILWTARVSGARPVKVHGTSDKPGCCSESLGSFLSKHTNSQAPFQTYKRISGRLGLKMFISKNNTRRLESSVCLQIVENQAGF